MKPFLKWAGSKSKYTKIISQFYVVSDSYVEPFLGSASVFFDIFDIENNIPCSNIVLSDINRNLINCFVQVKDNLEEFSLAVKSLENDHNRNPQQTYKEISKKINTFRGSVAAASFYYLNKTSFNGMWRENSRGEYNIPWNKKQNIKIYDELKFLEVYRFLNRINPNLVCGKFENIISKHLNKNTFFFLDPPYIPISKTSNFTSYSYIKWDKYQNESLCRKLKEIDECGGKFLMTNSSAPESYELFKKWNIMEFSCHRFIKALKSGEKREKINEIIVSNY